ncbi:NADP-dependent oxidoreductase [Streptomyces sp. Ag109_O5-10]|uniref:NADP-dependent oxidoreductase n=1 Tax=Streptomyces sp. Ag109_O5-10 TaxID=1855349 RepID=UPI000899C198|nr:NADP-dependent oxidoreductase [Streptomyces sp. Ag109_O5-10]SED58483.1 NADPH:quinone reductase [Streptomyces sp. Ag109_O5-10]
MKAVGVSRFGGPEALEIFEIPEPHAGPGQVRIRVHAATVNPGDRYLRNGAVAHLAPGPPYIPGMETAGVLDEIGPESVTGLRVGDRVTVMTMPLMEHAGGYAEYVVLPASWVVRAPAGVTYAQAATLPMNGLTARQALDLLALTPGQTLAVIGAAGVVGGYAVQLAKADGLTVIADASPADRELVHALGADTVIPRGDAVTDHILREAPGGVHGLLDAAVLGSATLAPAVRPGGGIAVLLGEGAKAMPPGELGRRSVRLHPVNVPDSLGDHVRLDRLRAQAEDGVLTLRVAGTFPPEQASDAHRLLEAGGVRGRLVLRFREEDADG